MIINLTKNKHFSEPQIHGMVAVVGVKRGILKQHEVPQHFVSMMFFTNTPSQNKSSIAYGEVLQIVSWRKLNYSRLILSKNQ